MCHRPDPLAAPRGMIIGFLLIIPLWAFLVWMLVSALNEGRAESVRIATIQQETDLGSSFRTANGGFR